MSVEISIAWSKNIINFILLVITIFLFDFLVFYQKKGILGFDLTQIFHNTSRLNKIVNNFRITELSVLAASVVLSFLLTTFIKHCCMPIFYVITTALVITYLGYSYLSSVREGGKPLSILQPETKLQYIFENRILEFFAILLIITSIGLVFYNIDSTPSITPLRWTFHGDVITVTGSRGFLYSLLIGWGIVSYFLTVLLSYDVANIITITKETVWGRKFIKKLAINRLIQAMWCLAWIAVWISSAIYSFNPIYLFFTISVSGVIAMLYLLTRCVRIIGEGRTTGFGKSLKTVFFILRFRTYLVFILQMLMAMSFAGSVIKI
ncbi:MAG: hypothetical protein H0Z30_02790 [Candidatus Marinimicrobia bacterium]|nr:hypothetical protein [Candidatus Neomarinimicrobiota bacterium]MCD6099818.1 hypothetical protein [Candidatus Neomarinimicrobiota bacterium]